MSKRKKILLWLIGLVGLLAVLLSVLGFFLPQLINLEDVKATLSNQYTENVGGVLNYSHLEIKFIPRPRLVAHQVRMSAPDNFWGSLEALEIYPRLWPLLRGSLIVERLQMKTPNFVVRLPEETKEEKEQAEQLTIEAIVQTFAATFLSLPDFKVPNLVVHITNGRFNLYDAGDHILELRDIQARSKRLPDRINVSFNCSSNLWQQIAITAWFIPEPFKSIGQIRLSQFQPKAVNQVLLLDNQMQITDAKLDIELNYQMDDPKNVRSDVTAVGAYLKMKQGREALTIESRHFKGILQLKDDKATATIRELVLATPQLQMSGELTVDQAAPEVKLELTGRQIDVAPLAALAVSLTNRQEDIATLFDVLRAGTVPQVTVSSHGRSLVDLLEPDNYLIKGRLTSGKIFIPYAELDLEDVYGDAVIENSVLTGSNLQARMGKSLGGEGNLVLGLTEDLTPFHLDINVQADLSQLPPILKRVVPDKDFQQELAQILDFKGTAIGNLELNMRPDTMVVKIEAADIQADANYQRLPYPVKITNGQFFMEGSQIVLANLSAAMGKSSISGLDTKLNWDRKPYLIAGAGSIAIDLEEFYPWLLSANLIKGNPWQFESLTGTISFQNPGVQGPLLQPRKWQFQSKGALNNIILDSARLPEALVVAKGKFSLKNARLDLNGIDTRLGKSSFTGSSARLDWGKTSKIKIRTKSANLDLAELFPWLMSYDNLRPILQNYAPVEGKLGLQQLVFESSLSDALSDQLKLSGDLGRSQINSKRLPGPVKITGGGFTMQGAAIKFEGLNGTIGKSAVVALSADFNWGSKLYFSAKSQSTQIQLDEIYPWLLTYKNIQNALDGITANKGVITLDHPQVSGPLNQPQLWHFHIPGRIKDLFLLTDFLQQPVTIIDGTFDAVKAGASEGKQTTVTIESKNLTWSESQIRLVSKIIFSGRRLSLEMDLSADDVKWANVEKILDYRQKQAHQNKNNALQFTGYLKVQSEKFEYGGLKWSTVQADINISPSETNIAVKKADLCGIPFHGFITVSDQALELYFVPVAENQELSPFAYCLSQKKDLITGNFDLNGELMAKTKPEAFPKSLGGNLNFDAQEGRIYRFGLLAKIFSILNLTEVYRGELPDLVGEGFAYNSMTVKAKVQGGKLIMEECAIDAASMGIACYGDIDIIDQKIDLVVLIAPFKTVDRIVKFIPLVNTILGGRLISIPFHAIGDLADPDVIPLSPTAVGSSVLGMMERTLKLPITIIQPVLPKSGRKPENQTKKPTDQSPHNDH